MKNISGVKVSHKIEPSARSEEDGRKNIIDRRNCI